MERRDFLKAAGASIPGVAILNTDTSVEENISHEDEEQLDEIFLYNDDIYVYFYGDGFKGGRQAFTEAGFVEPEDDVTVVTGDVATNPKSPYSKTESDSAEFESINNIQRPEESSGEKFDSYTIERNYRFPKNDLEVGIDWKVNLPEEGQYIIPELEITNLSDEELVLDQDEGDVHDGIQLFENARINEENRDEESYQFYIPGRQPQRLGESEGDFTYRHPTSDVTVFDDNLGATYGRLDGSTYPSMTVEKEDALDYMVREASLEPGESIGYTGLVAVHQGGKNAPRTGEDLYYEAQEMAEKYLEDRK